MGRNEKLYGYLEQLEDEFRSILIDGLENAKSTGSDWIFQDPDGSLVAQR